MRETVYGVLEKVPCPFFADNQSGCKLLEDAIGGLKTALGLLRMGAVRIERGGIADALQCFQ